MNHATAPQPTRSRIISLLWFPFFFAAAMSVLFLLASTHPSPHHLHLGMIGTAPAKLPAGIDVKPVTDFAGVARDQLAGVYDSSSHALYLSSAASSSRATYLTAVLHPVHTVDVVPLASGDVTGAGLFFYALPMLLVGIVTSIVLLQFGMWPVRKKVVTVAATGAFATVVAFAVARALDVIPADGWLLLYGFLLTQSIGWLTTALPRLVKQFYLPTAMTFVFILGIPTSGATVNADMFPTGVRWLHDVLPFGQFVEAARASAYFGNHGLARPLIILVAWTVAAALLLAWTTRPAKPIPPPRESTDYGHRRLYGTVRSTALVPVVGATVLALDDKGNELVRTTTGPNGDYEINDVRAGLHHLVVTATHHEPEIVTIIVHRHRAESARDVMLIDWDDPAGNLTAEEVADRRAPIG
jgi:hypothetical protein